MTTVSIPTLSVQQRQAALRQANLIRYARAALKADLKALTYQQGRRRVADLLDNPPSFIATMKVEDLLLCIPRFGDSKVRRLLFAYQVSPRKRVAGLSPRQRSELAKMLRGYTPDDLGSRL